MLLENLTATPAQKEAIIHPQTPLMILAGAGTGKTFTLENRIVYLIKHYNVKPEHILTITYTEKAAGELQKRLANKIEINSYNIIYELLDFIKDRLSGLLTPDVKEKIIGSAEILEIFKVSKVGKVAGSKVIEGEILQDSNARIIRDGTIVFNGKIGSIFREKNQAKQVSAGLECGITIKNFNDFQQKDIIEVYNSTVTERTI